MGRSKGEFLLGKNAVPLSKFINRQLISSPLTKLERWCYITTWILAVGYLCYCVFSASYEYEEELDNYFMSRGWWKLGRQKDKYDFEWEFWSSYFYAEWQWLLGHIILGQVCRYFGKTRKWLKYVYLCYSMVFLCKFLGGLVVLLLIIHLLIVYVCAALTRSTLYTGIMSVLLICTLNSSTLIHYMNVYLVRTEEGENRSFLLMMFVTAMCNLRYTSFAMEMCWHKQKQIVKYDKESKKKSSDKEPITEIENTLQTSSQNVVNKSPKSSPKSSQTEHTENSPKVKLKPFENSPRSRYKRNRHLGLDQQELYIKDEYASSSGCCTQPIKFSFMDAMLYVFYLPLFCTGPLLTYEKFQCQWNAPWQPWTWSLVKPIFLSSLRVLFWAVFCEVILHYMYFSSLMGDEQILSKVPLWTLAGIGHCQGQFFMVKYLVMFGIPACISSLDQLDAPKGPRCISAIYLYSDMWKYFDRGLYSFIKRYIYIPLGGSRKGLLRQFLASLCCFIFIFLWHGAEHDLFVWTLLNFVGVTIESIGHALVNTTVFNRLEVNYLGPAVTQRLKAASAVPVFAMSLIAIFTFFRGTKVGYLYYERLVLNGWPVPILTEYFLLYCSVQTAMEIDRWRKNKLKQE